MRKKQKIKSWLIKLMTPKVYNRLHRRFKNHQFWAFSQAPISKGLAAGLLFAFIPLPIQMFPAVLLAVLINGNVLIAAGAAFISNPLTFIPINYFILKVGGYVLGQHAPLPPIETFKLTISDWPNYLYVVKPWFNKIGKQFLVGFALVSVGASVLGYLLVNIIWILCRTIKSFKSKNT